MSAIALPTLALPTLEEILDDICPEAVSPLDEGYLMAQLGGTLADNPYTRWDEAEERVEWEEGFLAAVRDRWAAAA